MFQNKPFKKKQPKLTSPDNKLDFQNMDCIYSERGYSSFAAWANLRGFKERKENPDTYFVMETVAFGFNRNNLIVKLKHNNAGDCPNWEMWTKYWLGHSFNDFKRKMQELCDCTNGDQYEVQYNFHCGEEVYSYNINYEDDIVGVER